MTDIIKIKAKRGFAAMDPEKQREIARRGGKGVAPENRSFSKSPSLAASAGKKGGSLVSPKNRSFSRDVALAKSAGAIGGRAAQAKLKDQRDAD